jgi:RNA polymerase sigma factor (sigma-70 family)
LIIDFARQRRAQKHGADFHITRLDTQVAEQHAEPSAQEQELLRLSETLDALGAHDPQLADLGDLRYFCGFPLVEIAVQRGVSERTVQRDWERARLILFDALNDVE